MPRTQEFGTCSSACVVGSPGAVGVGMVLKSIFRQAGVSARWVSEGGLARAKRGRIDAVFVGGGDGTMLHAAQSTMGWGIPLLGINLGSLGFLTSIKAGEVGMVLPEILSGRYGLSTRSVLSVKLSGGNKSWSALNEVSVGTAGGAVDGEGSGQGRGRSFNGVSCGRTFGCKSDGIDGVLPFGWRTIGKSKGESDGADSCMCSCDGAETCGGRGAGGCGVNLE